MGCVDIQIDEVVAVGSSIRVAYQITAALDLESVEARIGRGITEASIADSHRLARGQVLRGSRSTQIQGLSADRFELRVSARLVSNGERITTVVALTSPDEDLRESVGGDALLQISDGGGESIEVPAAYYSADSESEDRR